MPDIFGPIIISINFIKFFMERGMMAKHEFRIPVFPNEFHLLVIKARQSLAIFKKRGIDYDEFAAVKTEGVPGGNTKIFFEFFHGFRRGIFPEVMIAGDQKNARIFYFMNIFQK